MEDDTILGELEDQVTCWICFELFQEPITLPCSHSFCKSCALKIYKKNPLCAFCRREFTVPLPIINHELVKLVQVYNRKVNGDTTMQDTTDTNSGSDVEQTALWLYLPDEVLVDVFSQLPARDLGNISGVCRHFHNIASDKFLWRELCRARWPFVKISMYGNDWKRCYSSRNVMQKGWESGSPKHFKVQTLRGHKNYINCFDYYRNNVVSGSADSTLKVWSVTSRKPLHSINAHNGVVNAVKFNEIRIVSGGADRNAKIWDTTSGSLVSTLAHAGAVKKVTFDESRIITSGDDNHVKVWDVRSASIQHDLTGHTASVFDLEFNGNRVYSCGQDSIKIWDLRNNAQVLRTMTGGTPTCFQVLEGHNRIVSGEANGSVRIWNTSNGTLFHHFPGGYGQAVNSIQSDGEMIVTGCNDNVIRTYDMKQRRHKQNLADHTAPVNMVQFDGHKIVSAGADMCLKVWDVKNGKRLYSLLGGSLQVRSSNPVHPTRKGASFLKFDEGRIVGSFRSLLRVYSFTGEDVNQAK